MAERYRLDLQTARDKIDDAHRQIGVAENGLLPDLNLNASTSVGNRFGTPAKSLDSRTLAYNAGITLNLPIDRWRANVYRTALINFAQAQRSLVDQTESVKSAVRDNLRLIQAAELNLEIQRRGIDLAQQRPVGIRLPSSASTARPAKLVARSGRGAGVASVCPGWIRAG